MATPPKSTARVLSERALYRRGEVALYRASRIHFRGRRGALRKLVRRYLKPHRRDRAFLRSLTSSVAKVLTAALLMLELGATAVDAQPSFSSSSPANATHATAVGSNTSATFSEAIATGTLSSATFVVHGGMTGQHGTGGTASTHRDGTYTGGNTATLTFNPGANFKAGELVQMTFTTGLQNGSAQALSAAKVVQFRAATSGGPAVFSNSSHDVAAATNATYDASLGDLDGDGDLDLVTGNFSSQVNRVYLGNGNGTFASGNDVDTPTNSTYDTELGDVDGDGDLDLVAGNNGRNRVYLGNGNGTFATGNDVDTPTNSTRRVKLGDVDGDGDLDLVAGNNGRNRVYLGNGNGAFATGSDVHTNTGQSEGLQLGDIDGDGDLDVVAGNYFTNSQFTYLGNGDGTFTANSHSVTGSPRIYNTELGDVDGDGDLDLVAAIRNAANKVYLGDGTGGFDSGSNVAATSGWTVEIALGDVDGDGDLDVVAGNQSIGSNKFYLSNGDGTFASGSNVDTPSNDTFGISLGDLDGDGDLDIVAGNNGQVNRVYLNNNTSFSSSSPTVNVNNTTTTSNLSATFNQTMSAATSSTFVVHGGFTGKRAGSYSGASSTILTFDPTSDLRAGEIVDVTLTAGLKGTSGDAAQKPKVYRFRAAATAGLAVFSNSSVDVETGTTNATRSVSLGDLDGDGDLDLVTGNYSSQVNRVYLGNGNGAFASGNDVDTPANSTFRTELGDLDGDGDLDLITGNNGVNRVYLGNGNGTFASGNDVDTPTNNTRSIPLGDLDGDGDLDIATGNYNQVNRVYLSNGNGTFASGNDVDTPTNKTFDASLGDVDGDGDLDLVVGNRGQVNRVYLNNGNGAFASGSDVDTPTNLTLTTALGDVDGDGDLDLVVGNQVTANRIYLGNGNGTFASGSDIATATGSSRVELADIDGDGDLDLAIGDVGVNRVQLGNGNGTFASGYDVDTPTHSTNAVSLGDVDGDGDLDMITSNLNQVNRVYHNGGNKDGTLTASATLDESSAIALPSTATTSAAAVDLFDFTLTDGGGGDGLTLDVSQVVVNTSGTGPFSQVNWLLNGPDASNVSGTYSSNKITFSGLSISVADGTSETYTLRGYYSSNTSLTDETTFSFSIDGDVDLTMSNTLKSSMAINNSSVSNTTASQVGVTATQLAFATQPSPLALTSGAQLDFTTDPVVSLKDAAGNLDLTATTVTLSENGVGLSSFSNHSVASSSGLATFTGLLLDYTATADQQTFGLVASASGVTSATSSNLTADVVATKLVFTTQPAPLALTSGTPLDFTTDPVVTAQDANGLTDTGFSNVVTLAESGAGSSTFSNNAVTPTSGVATFSGLALTYNALDASDIALSASASGVTGATSSSFAVTAFPLLVNNRGVQTGEGGRVVLSSDLLQFTDAASTAEQIIYTLDTVPAVGQLKKDGVVLGVGGTFTQGDINSSRISYSHSGREVFGDGFSFSVKGRAGLSTSSFNFSFAVTEGNDNPLVDVKQTLLLQEGEKIAITNGSLRVLDADNSSRDVVYTLINPPAHGRLSLTSFSQADIDEGRLTYQHDGSENTRDEFSFTVKDGRGGGLGVQVLAMEIAPVNDRPVVPSIDGVHGVEGQLLVLELGAEDPEGADVEMVVEGLPEGAIFQGTTLKWLPDYSQAGSYPMAVIYDDGQGGRERLRFDLGVADTPVPVIRPEPALLDFGEVASGQVAETSFTLHNTTPFPLEVREFTSSHRAFSVVPPAVLPIVLAPNETEECLVHFAARDGEVGVQQAVLTGATNVGALRVQVAGRSLWNGLETRSKVVDFGGRTIGFEPWKKIQVNNPGNVPLVISAQMPADSPFRVEPSAFALAGGQAGDLRVYYTPKVAGEVERVLLLMGTDAAVPREIVLRGKGLTPEQGRVAIDFNLADGDQQQRHLADVEPGDVVVLQLHVRDVRQIAGWSARIAFDERAMSYVEQSFVPGNFLSELTHLEELGRDYVEIGGDVLNRADPASGNGLLGTLSFRVGAGFSDRAELAVVRLTWRRAGNGGPARDMVYAPATLASAAMAGVVPGDFDGSGQVDLADFFLFVDAFQRLGSEVDPRFDLDGDGLVDLDDYFRFADLFDKRPR